MARSRRPGRTEEAAVSLKSSPKLSSPDFQFTATLESCPAGQRGLFANHLWFCRCWSSDRTSRVRDPPRPSGVLRPEPFPTAGPGLLLLYGALFTLLGFSERLYHPETIQTPRGNNWFWAKFFFGRRRWLSSRWMVGTSSDFANDPDGQRAAQFPDHAGLEKPLAARGETAAQGGLTCECSHHRSRENRPRTRVSHGRGSCL